MSFLNVNRAIGRNGAIDIAKKANELNTAIKEANGLNKAIKETTDPININQSSISDSKHEFEPGRH